MHEVGLMREAVRIALAHAERDGALRVHALTLRIGRWAGVEIDALQLAFEVAASDTAAQGAELRVEEAPALCWCDPCADLFQPVGNEFRCPRCQRVSNDIRQGREFDLVAVEVS